MSFDKHRTPSMASIKTTSIPVPIGGCDISHDQSDVVTGTGRLLKLMQIKTEPAD